MTSANNVRDVDEALRGFRCAPAIAIRVLDWLRAKGERETFIREVMQCGLGEAGRRSPNLKNMVTLRATATRGTEWTLTTRGKCVCVRSARRFDIAAIMRGVRAAV
jgi:hypothetical protein